MLNADAWKAHGYIMQTGNITYITYLEAGYCRGQVQAHMAMAGHLCLQPGRPGLMHLATCMAT